MKNLMQICWSTHSVILNATATQYTHSLNRVYSTHWLVQWSHHCSCMPIPVPSLWLPGYINVTQTILITLTVVGPFPDRPHIFFSICSPSFNQSSSPLFSYSCQSVPCFHASSSILIISLFCSLDSTYKWHHMVFVFHQLAYVPQRISLQFHSWLCKRSEFLLFFCYVVFHCVNVPQFLILSSTDGHLDVSKY